MEDIKINIPEGYEINKETSIINFEKGIINIKLKEKAKRWRDNQNAIIHGFWIDSHSDIDELLSSYNISENYNMFATEKYAKSALAMARISQIMTNDERFGGIITDEEWNNVDITKIVIYRFKNMIDTSAYGNTYHFLAFHTIEQTDLFLKENEDLVKQYLMID